MLNRLMLFASVMFGAALVAPSAALAQFGPPPGPPPAFAGPPPGFGAGGPPPGLGAGGPVLGSGAPGAPPRDIAGAPPHFSRLDRAAGPHGLDRGGRANLRGIEGRAAPLSPNSYARNRHASHRYGLANRYWLYAAAEASAYAGSYASSEEEDCYYVSAYRRDGYRRVLRCVGNWFNC